MYPKKSLQCFMNMKDGVEQNPTKDLVVLKGSDVSIGTQQEEEIMQWSQTTETTDWFKAQMQKNYDFQSRDQKQTLWLRIDKLNRLRGTFDDNLIGWEPAHVQNDVWAGRMNSRIWRMIASIRNILNQGTRNDNTKDTNEHC